MIKTYVLYHGNCPDGLGAAMAAWLYLGPSAEYIPVSYGKEIPEIESASTVYIVDFSYPKAVLENLYENVTRHLKVLDHHATAEAELKGLPYCVFDMNKSGAVLSWEYFFPTKPVPEFFLYLQDRDMWWFKMEKSREVSAAIGSYPFTMESFLNLYQNVGIERLKVEGEACLRLKTQQVDNMSKHHRWAIFQKSGRVDFAADHDGLGNEPHLYWCGPVANASVFFSEVGEKLLELNPEAQFSAYYSDRSDGKRQWGLRSRPTFDCSVIAKAFGGGGHKQASGFVQDV